MADNNKKILDFQEIKKEMLQFTDERGEQASDLFSSVRPLLRFYRLVFGTKYSVYALTGSWGSGKTSFIKMFQNIAESKNKNIIYIDAFKSDYESEPFNMIISAFAEYLNNSIIISDEAKKSLFQNAKKIAASTSKSVVKVVLGLLSKRILGADKEELQKAIAEVKDSFIDSLDFETSQKKNIYEDFKKATEEVVKKFEECVIIIDELDRCRPDFALETLERIKHIFNVQGLKFILIYNNEVFESIIDRTYGADSHRYLEKFIDCEFMLPTYHHTNKEWLEKALEDLTLMGMPDSVRKIYTTHNEEIATLMNKYRISPRTMIRILQNTDYIDDSNIGFDQDFHKEQIDIMCAVVEMLKYIDYENTQKLLSADYKDDKTFASLDKTHLHEISKLFDLGDGEKYFLEYLKWQKQFCTLKIV